MTRLAAGIEYEGTRYHGWQAQSHASSVQETLEAALSRVAGGRIVAHAAGRTDAGVHALGQIIHFDTDAERPEHGWMLGANVHLPADISVAWVRTTAPDFDARFSAIGRHYRYVIYNSRARSALTAHRACWYHYPLDVDAMNAGAASLIGEYDFSSYRATECQAKSPVREVRSITLYRRGNFIVLDIEANAFLHHMVRNIAGVLLAIGRGVRPSCWAEEVLLARDRRAAGVTAPPQGLYLIQVLYPAAFDIPSTTHDVARVLF